MHCPDAVVIRDTDDSDAAAIVTCVLDAVGGVDELADEIQLSTDDVHLCTNELEDWFTGECHKLLALPANRVLPDDEIQLAYGMLSTEQVSHSSMLFVQWSARCSDSKCTIDSRSS